jgi:hypothetical protein
MSTTQRKARKRAGIASVKPQKQRTLPPEMSVGRRRVPAKDRGLGLVSPAEILAGMLIRGRA